MCPYHCNPGCDTVSLTGKVWKTKSYNLTRTSYVVDAQSPHTCRWFEWSLRSWQRKWTSACVLQPDAPDKTANHRPAGWSHGGRTMSPPLASALNSEHVQVGLVTCIILATRMYSTSDIALATCRVLATGIVVHIIILSYKHSISYMQSISC